MHSGTVTYGTRVHTCPKCGAPYVDPKIVELAAVSESDRADYRLRYATESNLKKSLFAAFLLALASLSLVSGPLVHSLAQVALVFVGSFIGMNLVCFSVKFFVVFPKLARESAKRMTNAWYVMKLKACYSEAAYRLPDVFFSVRPEERDVCPAPFFCLFVKCLTIF